MLLLVVSALVLNYLYEYFAWYQEYPHFIWTNVPLWFAVGPLFFLHGQSLYRKSRSFHKTDLLHFLPSVFVILLFGEFYFATHGASKITAYHDMFGNDYNFDMVQILYIIQILVYGFLSIKANQNSLTRLQEGESDSSHIHLGFLKRIYSSLVLYAISALVLALVLALFKEQYSHLMRYYSFVFLALASMVHITSYHLVFFRPVAVQDKAPPTFPPTKNAGKYASSSLDEQELHTLLQQLQAHISDKESFKNPNLRIADLSQELDIPSHYISQCLNQVLGKNFFDFINEYRVAAVKQNLLDPAYSNYTLFAIASEVGFNSHSSFYRIFKKFTGLTPKAYIEREGPDE